MPARGKANGKYQGMNWLTPHKRLAIYLRDGLACCYCGEGVEDGTRLTLDHLTPHSMGGGNEASNLATACVRCNSSRGNRDWKVFVKSVANYVNHDVKAADILAFIRKTIKRELNVNEAKELISRRGGFSEALRTARKEQ